ncbi:hypothetical protein AB0C81_18175 [Streptomyces roseoverticillatus]|uniref:hypothetical protein n=1 Tax=Streptomyces roseoverticillatus TaxID=66429 RepID=UPI0033DD2139
MAQHPLTLLRRSLGFSQLRYAQRVAEEQGFDPRTVKAHYKVLRWESGTTPELDSQFAIARIHRIPEEEVLQRGWPNWLLLATGDAPLLDQPWTSQGTLGSLRSTVRPPGWHPPAYLAVTGAALDSQIRKALATLASPPSPPAGEGFPLPPGTVAGVERRIADLELQAGGSPLTPMTLYHAACQEHRTTTAYLTSGQYDRRNGTRLLLLAARTARLCAWFSMCLGDEHMTERYLHAAIRASATAGERQAVAMYMAHLAFRHLKVGDPREAFSLLRAARAAEPNATPILAATLHAHAALAYARVGDSKASTQATDRATRAIATAMTDMPDAHIDSALKETLGLLGGLTWLHLEQPSKALTHFAPLLDDGSSPHLSAPPPPLIARGLLGVVMAQLALGELDAATHTAHRAVAALGDLPTSLARQYRQTFAPHRNHSAVPELLGFLAEHHQ